MKYVAWVLFIVASFMTSGCAFMSLSDFLKESKQQTQLHRQVQATNNEFPFREPQDGMMQEERFAAWLRVQSKAFIAEQKLMQVLKAQYQGSDIGMGAKLLDQEIGARLTVMHAEKMSFDEYKWITAQIMGGLSSTQAKANPQLVEMADRNDYANQNALQPAKMTSEQSKHVLGLITKHLSDLKRDHRANGPELDSDRMFIEMMVMRKNIEEGK